jgi:hypothetical protein
LILEGTSFDLWEAAEEAEEEEDELIDTGKHIR